MISFLDSDGNTLFCLKLSVWLKRVGEKLRLTGRFLENLFPVESFYEVHSIVVEPYNSPPR